MPDMKTSLQGAMEIIGHEAIVLTPYKDSVGVLTIGVGHTKAAGGLNPATFKGKLTVKEAFDMFRADLAKYEKRVNAAFTVTLKQHEFDAAVSFDFNTGAINRATWVKRFNAGDRTGAIRDIMQWRKPPEIISRRQKEQKLFGQGLYSGDGTGLVYDRFPGPARRVNLANEFGGLPSTQPPADTHKPVPIPTILPAPQTSPAPVSGGFWARLAEMILKLFKGGR
ncbi:MAG: lysozyme [Sphingomonadaceae bacterium]|nr:lysozyme [Sphingomonadaceae bacterium]